jgi:peptide/nickel transport system permease protein
MSGFGKYMLKRLLNMLFSLFVLITLLFFMFRLIPGDPLSMYIDVDITIEAKEMLMKQFGLDKPLFQQYVAYIKNLAHGNFGLSFQYNKPALEIVGARFWSTCILMVTSLGIAFFIGIVAGTVLAWMRGTRFEITSIIAVLCIRCAPVFWIGMIFVMVFAFKLHWFPLGGMNTPGTHFDNAWQKYFNRDFLYHLFLPAITCGINMAATPLLVMRASMLEVIKEDFIELATARGLSKTRVMFKHAMRNALLPVATLFAVEAGLAVGGVVLIETVFRWPGMGREIVLAIGARDYPVAQTAFVMIGAMVILFNLLADVIYAYLDPRVTYN